MYKLNNRLFVVTDISTLEETVYEGMRSCSQATGISMYKLHLIAEEMNNMGECSDEYVTTTKGNAYKVRCLVDVNEPVVVAYPVVADLFTPIKFKSITKLIQQFGIGKNTIYRRWAEAYPVYEDNPTELIVKYWQNNSPVTCKSGNAYGEKFILRFYKEYNKGDKEAFEEHKGFK